VGRQAGALAPRRPRGVERLRVRPRQSVATSCWSSAGSSTASTPRSVEAGSSSAAPRT
jgi:hypothetical protein